MHTWHIRSNSLLCCLASAVNPNWENPEEAHPRWARGAEDHLWGADPEVSGCSHRSCESVSSSHLLKEEKSRLFHSFTNSKQGGNWTMPTSVWRPSTTNSEIRRWVQALVSASVNNVLLVHQPPALLFFSAALCSHCRRSTQHSQEHWEQMLHGGPQHPHPHRQQQQLQRDVGVHARPEGGADAGQQTRGLTVLRLSQAHGYLWGRSVVRSHFTLNCIRRDDKCFKVLFMPTMFLFFGTN